MKLIQEEHDAKMKGRGGDHKSEDFKNQSGEIPHFEKNMTRTEVAKEHHISQDAVRSAVEVGRGLDRAGEVDPKRKQRQVYPLARLFRSRFFMKAWCLL